MAGIVPTGVNVADLVICMQGGLRTDSEVLLLYGSLMLVPIEAFREHGGGLIPMFSKVCRSQTKWYLVSGTTWQVIFMQAEQIGKMTKAC